MYPNAKFEGGACGENTSATTTDDYPEPPCLCQHANTSYDPMCDGDSNTGTSTTSTTETTGSVPQQYICTVFAQEKCVYYNYVNDPLLDDDKKCWVDPNYSDYIQPCVMAVDEEDAETQCEDLCNDHKTDVIEAEITAWNLMNLGSPKTVVSPAIDCTIDDSPAGDYPMELDAPYSCAPETFRPLPGWSGSTDLKVLEATVSYATSIGAAGNGGVAGYIGYEVTNCGTGLCDFTIDALEMVETDLSGVFADVSGPIASYVLEGVDLHLVQAVQGTLNESSGVISFSGGDFFAVMKVDDVSIDTSSAGYQEGTYASTQASGLMDGGILTLELEIDLGNGVFTVDIETLE